MDDARMKRILDYCFLADAELEPLGPEDALIDKANELALMRAKTPAEAADIWRRRHAHRCNATSPTTASSRFLPFSIAAEQYEEYWQDQEAAFTCCCGDDMDNHGWDETHSPTSYASHARHLREQELREATSTAATTRSSLRFSKPDTQGETTWQQALPQTQRQQRCFDGFRSSRSRAAKTPAGFGRVPHQRAMAS